MADSNDLPVLNSDPVPENETPNLPSVTEGAPPGPTDYSFGANLTYMFKDPKWIGKMLIGGLLGIIPILNFVLGGYTLQTINRVRKDEDPVLPEWGGAFGKMWVDGLKLAVIGFIYSIPIGLVLMVTGTPAALMAGSGNDSDAMGFALGAAACLGGLLSLVLWAFILFWLIGAFVNFAVKDGSFGAAFEFGKIWNIVKTHAGKIVMVIIAAVIASVLAGVVAGLLFVIPCIGWIVGWIVSFVTAFYILLVMAYTCGHIAKTV